MSVQFNSNLNIPIVGNRAITEITSGYSSDRSVARLFIFPPRRVIDTCKRPHTYDLSQQFVDNVTDRVYNTIHGSGSGDVHRASYMDDIPSAVGAVIPSNHGYMVNNRPFEENWTWIFQLDNVSNNTGSIYTGPRLCNRRVYCGYFVNEPCTRNMGRVIENPSAVMHILHSSAFRVDRTASATGTMNRMIMNADTDFVPASVCMMTNSNLTELLRPQDIAESSAPTSEGGTWVSNFNSLSANENKIIPVNTSIGSPRQHLHELVMSAMRGVEEATVNTSTASVLSPITNSAFGTGVGNISNCIHNNLVSTVGADTIGLDGTSTYQLATLRSMFPGMELIVSEAPMGSIDDLANQSVITRSNSGSNIVVTTVPVLASNCGLSELAFRYTSYVPVDGFVINNSIGNRDAFKFDNFATWSEEPDTVSKNRIKSFMDHFRRQVTPMLYHLGGDFELMCSYTSSGLCDVLLIYNEDPTNTMGIYQSPLFLGGLNTPIVGSNSDKQHNADQLQSFKYGIEAGMHERLNTTRQYNGFNSIRPLSDFHDPAIGSSGFAEGLFNNMNF